MTDLNRRNLLTGIAAASLVTVPAMASAADRPDLDGLGFIYVDGRPVMFDSRITHATPGASMLVRDRLPRGGTHLAIATATEHPERQGAPAGYCNIDFPEMTASSGYHCVRQIPFIGRVVNISER